jgi:predicted regulator of Ras-like GTPase activity (Roadblock/LC7/MglB family)
MTRGDQLTFALNEFLSVSPDVEAAAVVSVDGLPMSSALPDTIEEDRLAAMSAALLTLGERAAAGLNKGGLAQVYVEGEQGNVVLMAAGDYAVLVAMTARRAKAGLVLFEMRRIAARIADILEIAESPATSAAEERAPVEAGSSYDVTHPTTWHEPVQPTPEWEPSPASDAAPSPWGDQADQAEERPREWDGEPSQEQPDWARGAQEGTSGDHGSEGRSWESESQEDEPSHRTWG